jgi:TonB-dependent receptor
VQHERTLAGYVMAKIETGALLAVAGVRAERYMFDNNGTVLAGGRATALTYTRSKTDFFPSLNLRYEATDNLVLRLAGQRGVSRPAFGAIRVGASINDTNSPGTIAGGNPALKPEYTWGADASIEYYLPGNGMISIAGFHRWVDNVFYQAQNRVGTDFYDFGGIDRSNYLLTGTYNGDSGKLYGIEFNLLKQARSPASVSRATSPCSTVISTRPLNKACSSRACRTKSPTLPCSTRSTAYRRGSAISGAPTGSIRWAASAAASTARATRTSTCRCAMR